MVQPASFAIFATPQRYEKSCCVFPDAWDDEREQQRLFCSAGRHAVSHWASEDVSHRCVRCQVERTRPLTQSSVNDSAQHPGRQCLRMLGARRHSRAVVGVRQRCSEYGPSWSLPQDIISSQYHKLHA
ncbi:hypothetical protein E2C01_082353 [Portunus trituberculatus]|uniref:Uncharacterized protein n=1 Tax=Portunus trituberculatus TaxID=210409 RepID=A0A5B7IPQ2_PORTR|nr:hypothetical protein [Portunus trituberculatus]